MKTLKTKKMIVATKFGFGNRLCKGKVLAPLISVVLYGDHLARFLIRILAFIICFLLGIEMLKGKIKGSQKGFY